MDATDRSMLAELEADGRMTITELAERVHISTPACHRRLRALEDAGVIRGYRAIVDPKALGAGFEVMVHVVMDREDAASIAEFERAVAEVPEVRDAERLFGDLDYVLRVATADIEAYQRLRDEVLGRLPGISRLTSIIVMKRVVEARSYVALTATSSPRPSAGRRS